jgi:hypothetical protein
MVVSIYPAFQETSDGPVAAAEVPEAQSLLRRQIDHDEAVGARLLRVLQHALLAVAQQRVVVAHEQHRRLEAALPGVADHLQHILGVDAVLERLRVGRLDGGAVGDGVGEGHAHFDDVCERQLARSMLTPEPIAL